MPGQDEQDAGGEDDRKLPAQSPVKAQAAIGIFAVDYLKAWLTIRQEAKLHDLKSMHMTMVNARRKNVHTLMKENDPGGKALRKFLGEELTEAALSIVEP